MGGPGVTAPKILPPSPPADHVPAEGWRDLALCLGGPTDLWFPPRGEPTAPAKAVCASCPVRQECLDHAIRNDERHDMWGGLTPSERASARCRRPGCRNGVIDGPAGYCSRNCQRYVSRVQREKNGAHGKIDRARGGCRCAECSAVMDRVRARKVARRGRIRAEVAS